MLKGYWIRISAAAFLLVVAAAAARSQASGKKKVNSQADLPRFTYAISVPASDLVQADAAVFSAFARRVRTDLDAVLRDYDIDDKATLRALWSAKLNLQQAVGENEPALQTLTHLLTLGEKPTDNLEAKILIKPELQASIETNSVSGPAFEQALRKYCREALNSMPWTVLRSPTRSFLGGSATFSRAVLIGDVKANFDPAVQKSGVLDNKQAWTLVHQRNLLQVFLPSKGGVVEVTRQYVAAHRDEQADIWPDREVTLADSDHLTPVLVGIWDSGVDVSIFSGQLFTDPHPTASGSHGLAFDDFGQPSTSWLFPLKTDEQRQYPDFLAEEKGVQDLDDGIDSPEAQAAQKRATTLTSEQLRDWERMQISFASYTHGTHVAGIAARGNPAVRLVVARFDDDITHLPFQPSVEWARTLSADFRQIAEYFRSRQVRVVNMSWDNDPAEFEAWLSNSGAGADPADRKRRADEIFSIWRAAVETAIRSAPNTLFVCAAGNANRNPGFAQDVPASLQLSNLIAVGAVDRAGEETNFTSYGDTVVVHANGYDVESYVPGGSKLKYSGTSMAAPNVTNVAAKLIALDPSLTPVQVIQLIRKGATVSENGRLHLIDPKRSVALLKTGTVHRRRESAVSAVPRERADP